MSDLIMRAEQGVLGALLAGRDHPLIAEHLTAADFGHPAHQAIYRALLDLEPVAHSTERLPTAVASLIDHPAVDAAWLRTMAATAPDSERVRAYAQIVVQAAFDRDTADFAQPYLAAADLATNAATRAGLTRLGQALTAQADTFTPHATIDPDHTLRTASTTPTRPGPDLHREDQIIADLLQHPDQARAVAAWLDSAVFTTEQRRLSYELAVSLAYDHDPIDPVILAWHVQRARDINTLYQRPSQLTDPRTETDYAYLTRLHNSPIPAGTAVHVGRDLLTEHTQATLALSATAAAERAVHAGATHGIGQTPTHGVAPTGAPPPMTTAPTISPRGVQR